MGSNQRNGWNPVGFFQKVKLPWADLDLPWPRPETQGELDMEKLAQNFATLEERLNENHYYLDRIDWGPTNGGRWATFVIAASNSSSASKQSADLVCTGSGDEVTIIAAIARVLANANAGRLVLLEGTYNLSASITVALGPGSELSIEGMGGAGFKHTSATGATVIEGSTLTDHVFKVTGGPCSFRGLTIRGNTGATSHGINSGHQLLVDGCHITAQTGIRIFTTVGGDGDGSKIIDNYISSTGNCIDINSADDVVIANNTVYNTTTGASAIKWLHSLGVSSRSVCVGNVVTAHSGSIGIECGGNGTSGSVVSGNLIIGALKGIYVAGAGIAVVGNDIRSVGICIELSGAQSCLISSNDCYPTGTPATNINLFGCDNNFVIANMFSANASGSNITVGAGCTNNAVVMNYSTGGTVTSVTNLGTNTKTENNFFSVIPAGGASQFVLKKNSATDYDTGWAVDPALDLLSAKGSIVVATAADTGADLTVGRDDTILTPDSSLAKGVKWGRRISVQSTAPTLPVFGDVWLDTT